jgi:hypothetical protein
MQGISSVKWTCKEISTKEGTYASVRMRATDFAPFSWTVVVAHRMIVVEMVLKGLIVISIVADKVFIQKIVVLGS